MLGARKRVVIPIIAQGMPPTTRTSSYLPRAPLASPLLPLMLPQPSLIRIFVVLNESPHTTSPTGWSRSAAKRILTYNEWAPPVNSREPANQSSWYDNPLCSAPHGLAVFREYNPFILFAKIAARALCLLSFCSCSSVFFFAQLSPCLLLLSNAQLQQRITQLI